MESASIRKRKGMQKIKEAYDLAKNNDKIISLTLADLKEINFDKRIEITEVIKRYEMSYGISLDILSDIYYKYRYLFNNIIIESDGTIKGTRIESDDEYKKRICLIFNKKLEEKRLIKCHPN